MSTPSFNGSSPFDVYALMTNMASRLSAFRGFSTCLVTCSAKSCRQ